MNKLLLPLFILFVFAFTACHTKTAPAEEQQEQRLLIRFELDSAGAITDTAVINQLSDLAKRVSANADRVVMYSYTEQMDSAGQDVAMAQERAIAAKAIMFKAAKERIYYSVGIEAMGYKEPLSANPKSADNRRIEIKYLK